MSEAKDVFEILMRENAEMLLAYLRASVRDRHAVDDIFQETMVVAWRRLSDFDRTASFGKWIRGIAAKLVLVHYRKSGRDPLNLDEHSLEWMDGRLTRLQSANGDKLSEKLVLLRECVDALSDDNRAAIEARYFQQLSLDEVVSKMGVALQTVKKRLYRARVQLSGCLDRKLPALEESV
ncbi:MAG: sigma-70 family RNA polymerase sigma factor [Planctomycetota bacterium]